MYWWYDKIYDKYGKQRLFVYKFAASCGGGWLTSFIGVNIIFIDYMEMPKHTPAIVNLDYQKTCQVLSEIFEAEVRATFNPIFISTSVLLTDSFYAPNQNFLINWIKNPFFENPNSRTDIDKIRYWCNALKEIRNDFRNNYPIWTINRHLGHLHSLDPYRVSRQDIENYDWDLFSLFSWLAAYHIFKKVVPLNNIPKKSLDDLDWPITNNPENVLFSNYLETREFKVWATIWIHYIVINYTQNKNPPPFPIISD